MPQMTISVPDVLVVVVLITCVPLQYFIIQNWSLTESGRTYALNGLFSRLTKFRENYFEWESWKHWLEASSGISLTSDLSSDLDDTGESPAIEVMKHKQKNGFFGFSTEMRTNRSPDVKFRVGQVISHKSWKYRGVIIGWDEKAKAPNEWFKSMHGEDNTKLRNMPNYSILVDIRDRMTPQFTYVPQEQLEIIKNTKIIHPLTENYFENFDGAQYIPRPWLKTLYPQD